jgi:hypothetical protein
MTTTLSAAMSTIISELRQEPYECADLSIVTNWLGGDHDIAKEAITELILSNVVYVRGESIYLYPKYQRPKEK